MFYYFSQLENFFLGLNIFRYITFRSGMAAVTTFLLCMVLGPLFIAYMRRMKIGELAKRDDCPDLEKYMAGKDGTPTMGGLFIISSVLISVLLWADMSNHFVQLTMLTCIWLAALGFVDDYMKLKRIGKDRGLTKRQKMLGQILIGSFVGSYIYFHPGVSSVIDLPFFKDVIFDLGFLYIPAVTVIIVGTSNAVNLTDGLDGLAIGCTMIVSMTLAILCYITGHALISKYLLIPYIPATGELTVFCMAMFGASLGFLWFNSYPATVFMGDIGSLSIGGTLGIIAVLIKKEILLILIGGVFVMEAGSVVLQVASFKLRKGKRVFKMAPFHHHLQLSGWKESKIINRLWILAIIFALLALTTLKIR